MQEKYSGKEEPNESNAIEAKTSRTRIDARSWKAHEFELENDKPPLPGSSDSNPSGIVWRIADDGKRFRALPRLANGSLADDRRGPFQGLASRIRYLRQ